MIIQFDGKALRTKIRVALLRGNELVRWRYDLSSLYFTNAVFICD
ncbi:hypothetical protein QUF81_23060 [Peribacillus simplex]|nr:hypothetical protein [Peribacillus simplex]MDM5295989.1 hypothetical protein [Peribacillus simplex]